jgi:hypothetical protein
MKFLLCIVSIAIAAFLLSYAMRKENQIRQQEYNNCYINHSSCQESR